MRSAQGLCLFITLYLAVVLGLAGEIQPAYADEPDNSGLLVTVGSGDASTGTMIELPPGTESRPAVAVAVVTDQNGNPRPGQAVTVFPSDPSRFRPVCATNALFSGAGFTFNPIIPGPLPWLGAPPAAGFSPGPAQPFNFPVFFGFPLPGLSFQFTPFGYTCFSNPFSIPPGAVTVLTDATGAAYIGLTPIPRP